MQHILKNDSLTLTVDEQGAEVKSVKNTVGEEMMWCGDPAVWGRVAPILFPWTGKLHGSSFICGGQTYPAGQHGFARDMVHALVRKDTTALTLQLNSDESTRAHFPFDFSLQSTFRLSGNTVHHTLQVTNTGSKPLPFGIGYHPAFALPFDDAHTTADYELRFDRVQSPLVVDARPNGRVSGKCFYLARNTAALPLADRMFDNDSLCMANLTAETIALVEKDTGRSIRCDISGFPYTVIWSKPTEKLKFVCIEPWYSIPGTESGTDDFADYPAAAVLAPNESWAVTLSTTFNR